MAPIWGHGTSWLWTEAIELPDFGRPFDFGYAFTAQNSTMALQAQLSLDNMFVEITTVPEPNGVILVLAMGASVVWSRCWQIWNTGMGNSGLAGRD